MKFKLLTSTFRMNAFILYFFLIVVINCHVIYAYANCAPEKVFSYS